MVLQILQKYCAQATKNEVYSRVIAKVTIKPHTNKPRIGVEFTVIWDL